jgi:thiol-disulfide isomerase/thioredoxin
MRMKNRSSRFRDRVVEGEAPAEPRPAGRLALPRRSIVNGFLSAFPFVFSLATTAQADLAVGDAAPPLKIKEWVRGDAVNLAKEASKRIHMIEFWATWCPPCKQSVPLLTDFQKKHAKDLVVIGVTDADPFRNSVTEIRDFVKEYGDKMAYTVAIDDDGATTKAYMPSEVAGIPQAFLVGRDGKVVWQGSPLDPALEKVIPDVISGKYDLSKAKKAAELEQEVTRRFQTLDMAYQLGQIEAVWEGVVDILRIDPANETAMQILTSLYTEEAKKAEPFRRWARDHIGKHKTDAAAMTRLAQVLCDNPDLSTRTPDLALEAAKAAYDASQQREAAAVSVYGRALYQVGDLDRAISLQKDVISLVSDKDKELAERILRFYEQCKKLQGTN